MSEEYPVGGILRPMSTERPWGRNECRFWMIDDIRRQQRIERKDFAKRVAKTYTWYVDVQKWRLEPDWADVLAMLDVLGLNLERIRGHILKHIPPITAKDYAEDVRKVRGYLSRVQENRKRKSMGLPKLAPPTYAVAEEPAPARKRGKKR